MIKLPDGELRDFLPSTMKNDVDMICLSYAIKKATERLLEYQRSAMIYQFIDDVPEQVIDIMAVELRSPYYSDTLPIDTKREIVKNTLRWHAKAGTPSAVEEMIQSVFGNGEVIEWFDFDEPPYTPGTFDIVTDAIMTEGNMEQLLIAIEKVKNTRSHLRQILIKRRTDQTIFAGVGQFLHHKPSAIIDGYKVQRKINQEIFTGTSQFPSYKPSAIIDGYNEKRTAKGIIHTGTGQTSHTHQSVILEKLSFKNKVCQKSSTGTATVTEKINAPAIFSI